MKRGGRVPREIRKREPSEEEKAEKELQAYFAKVARARAAIVEACKGPWKFGSPYKQGTCDCPVCGKTQTLRYTRSSLNGHIHANCMTEGCVRWME